MWKITIEYDDHSKCVLKGKHKDIPLRLANKYFYQYCNSISCIRCVYQQYPLKDHKPMDLSEKIEELEETENEIKEFGRKIGD
nr:MAG TPA: hypothetical protein [Caudoviricetes sp.]